MDQIMLLTRRANRLALVAFFSPTAVLLAMTIWHLIRK